MELDKKMIRFGNSKNEVNHHMLKYLILRAHETKTPLMIWGTTGIGKSQTVYEQSIEIANSKNRMIVDWNRASNETKLELLENKEKRMASYIFADNRLVDKDPSDLRGLPFDEMKYVSWKPTLLFKVLSSEGSAGMLFFDEINLASPSIQGTAYQIILDKCVGELALNPEIDIIAAGNRSEDKANVFDMAVPLRARFSHITLSPPTENEWCEWAFNHKIKDSIIAFIKFRPSLLMADIEKLKTMKSKAVNCPRTWVYMNNMIKDEKDLDVVECLASVCVGESSAREYSAFLKTKDVIDFDDILKNPEKAMGLELEMKWCLISGLSEKYNADKKLLNSIFNLALHIEPDFGASLLRMVRRQDDQYFKNNAMKCDKWANIVDKLGKYILSNYEG